MKSILFKTAMIRAILDGRKTVTRRPMKPQPIMAAEGMWQWKDCQWMDGGLGFPTSGIEDYAPYLPGQEIYVRETWYYETFYEECFGSEGEKLPSGRYAHRYVYKADNPKYPVIPGVWHPSIRMPREAARIFLRVTGVRVERLNEIDGQGLIDEGLFSLDELRHGLMRDKFAAFEKLWDSTIKPADRALYGWDANPWVWAIAFERCEKPEGGTE